MANLAVSDTAGETRRVWYRRDVAIAFWNRSWLTVLLAVLAFAGVWCFDAQRNVDEWRQLYAGQKTLWDLQDFEAVTHLKAGIRTALTAFVFSAAYLLVVKIVGGIYRFLSDIFRARTKLQFTLELATYLLFVAVALLPMSMLMEFDIIRALTSNERAVVLLLMINGLLFFIGVGFINFIITESHKSYATSAEFKCSSRAAMTREASCQFLVSRWASVYYFVLTFTMVPEIIEPGSDILFRETMGENIVKTIFYTIFNEKEATSTLAIQILAFIATALLFRLIIEQIVLTSDLKMGIEAGHQ